MDKDYFNRVRGYKSAMAQARVMLTDGIISDFEKSLSANLHIHLQWIVRMNTPQTGGTPMTNEQKAKIIDNRGQGYSYKAISDMLGISVNTVTSFCRRLKLGGKSADIKAVVHCKNCGKPIKNKTGCKPKIFCSDACRWEWWNSHLEQVERKAVYSFTCPHCGSAFSAYGNRKRKYCSRSCYFADRFSKGVESCEG